MLNRNKIKARMTELGLTQKDVAEALKIAPSTASQKINGVRPLYLDEAQKLTEILKIEARDFSAYFFAH